MTPESRKSFNTAMGSLLIGNALICFGLAGYLIFVPAETKAAPAPQIAPVDKQACITGLKGLGFMANAVAGDDISVTGYQTQVAAQDRLKNASLGIAMCGMYLEKFCLGPSCVGQAPSTMTFTLTPHDPKLPKPAAKATGPAKVKDKKVKVPGAEPAN